MSIREDIFHVWHYFDSKHFSRKDSGSIASSNQDDLDRAISIYEEEYLRLVLGDLFDEFGNNKSGLT